ncbi:unnamed protein product, partial [Amoebophrya sp. A25]|eukprot:GSA25T00008741001.1
MWQLLLGLRVVTAIGRKILADPNIISVDLTRDAVEAKMNEVWSLQCGEVAFKYAEHCDREDVMMGYEVLDSAYT